jgi:hypothetical protein
MATGRPSKLTAELIEQFVTAITAGTSFDGACKVVGLSHDTANSWLQRVKNGQGNSLQKEFSQRYYEAVGKGEQSLAFIVRKAAITDPALALRLLERSPHYSSNWSPSGLGKKMVREERKAFISALESEGIDSALIEKILLRLVAESGIE